MIEADKSLDLIYQKAKNLPKKSPERQKIETLSKHAERLLKELKDPLFTTRWKAQADRLVQLGVPQHLRMDEKQYRKSLPKFTDEPYVQIGRDLAVESYSPVLVETRLSLAALLKLAGIQVVGNLLTEYKNHRVFQSPQKTPYIAWNIDDRVENAQHLKSLRRRYQETGLTQAGITKLGRLVHGKYTESEITAVEGANWFIQCPDLAMFLDVQLDLKNEPLESDVTRTSSFRIGTYEEKPVLILFVIEPKPWKESP